MIAGGGPDGGTGRDGWDLPRRSKGATDTFLDTAGDANSDAIAVTGLITFLGTMTIDFRFSKARISLNVMIAQ
jgi:hypothetical protein